MLRTSDLPTTLNSRLVSAEPLVVAMPDSHPLAGSSRIALEKLSQERFLGFERHQGPVMFDAIVAVCMRHGFSPKLFPARQMHTIVSLVSGGIGVALVPASVQVLQREGVVYRNMLSRTCSSSSLWMSPSRPPARKTFALLSSAPPVAFRFRSSALSAGARPPIEQRPPRCRARPVSGH